MKNVYSTVVLLLLALFSFAQAPEQMSYQAVVRDASGTLVANQVVGMQISILQSSTSGTVVYTETQTPTSNANGLVTLALGTGVSSNVFSAIDWSAGPYFIKTETDPNGGTNYGLTSTQQLMSVPYALYAKTSGSATPGPQGPEGPTTEMHLTGAFIPIHPDTTESLSLSFVTAATGQGSISGGTCPPGQVYNYDIVDCNGTSIFNGDIAIAFPNNAKSFGDGETNLSTAPESYTVVIIGSAQVQPLAPCSVDIWVSDIVQDVNRTGVFTRVFYQFSWSASQEWIHARWQENGNSFIGPMYPNGIPILRNSNHTLTINP